MNRALVVTYHYVRPRDADTPGGIRPLWVNEFEEQLDWLGSHFEVLAPEVFLERLRAPGESARPPALLTFDDGTRDHLEVVTPVLERRGWSGVFFVLTGPLERRMMPLTHAIHWLLGGDENEIWEAFRARVKDTPGGERSLGSPERAAQFYHYEDSPLRARIKYAANVALPPGETEAVIRDVAEQWGRTLESLIEEWFLGEDELRELKSRGMTIGSHAVSHRSVQSLGATGIANEIAEASATLTRIFDAPPRWFTCPFGATGATPEVEWAMRAALREAGIRAAVTVEKGCVTPSSDPLSLPRFDATDLPPRRHLAGIPA